MCIFFKKAKPSTLTSPTGFLGPRSSGEADILALIALSLWLPWWAYKSSSILLEPLATKASFIYQSPYSDAQDNPAIPRRLDYGYGVVAQTHWAQASCLVVELAEPNLTLEEPHLCRF